MAGSTATVHREVANRLQVITLTINNRCNLRCPHCYLQYDGQTDGMSEATLEAVVRSSARHVAIVGKEPLVDRPSVLMTERLVDECLSNGKTVSLITNGLGIHRLSSATVALLEWIDVSLDGGPATYKLYRQGDFGKVIRNVRSALDRGARSVNALHTVSSLNLACVDDMMVASQLARWNKIIFSPYAEVRNHGSNPTTTIPFSAFFAALGRSEPFLRHPSAFVLIGTHAFEEQGANAQMVVRAIEDAGVAGKVLRVEHDPLLLGYIRVTYDGYLLTPYQSLHPADYREYAIPLDRHPSVDAVFQYLRAA